MAWSILCCLASFMLNRVWRVCGGTGVFFAVVAIVAGAARASTIVVAASGQATPDGNGTISSFGRPVLNDAGQAAFPALLTGTSGGTSDDSGIFLGSGGPLTQIVREGDASPDGNGNMAVLFNPAINDAGQVAFKSSLSGTSGGAGDNEGIFRGTGGTLTQIARKGQTAPDANGVYSLLFDPVFNNAGQAAFKANLTGTGGGSADDTGRFLGSGGAVTQIVREGDAAPDSDGTFTFLGEVSLNEGGQVAFKSSLTGTVNTQGVFRGSGGALTQIVRRNDAAPDGNGVFSTSFDDPVINDFGQAVFTASLTGTSGGSSDNSGVFRGSGGAVTQIARKGQASPDGNGIFQGLLDPMINNAGQVVVSATLTGTSGGSSDNLGVYRGDGVTLTQIAREGQFVPDGLGTFSSFSNVAVNDTGQVAFSANIAAGFPQGIFFYDDSLGLLQAARVGDPLLGSTIQFFDFALINEQGDERNGLNNLGQVAYGFTLVSGVKGVAVWSPPAPPPGSSPDDPILPDSGGGGDPLVFDNQPGDGNWFDPPPASGYVYQTDGNSNFVEVGLPPLTSVADGDGLYLVASIYGNQVVSAGGNYAFPSPVDSFTITGIDPFVDGGDPLAFPTFLLFDQQTVSFTMTPVPEPAALLLAAVGLLPVGLGARRRRRPA